MIVEDGISNSDHDDHQKEIAQEKSGYKFFNYTGTAIKFCISDDQLDDEMKLPLKRQNNIMRTEMRDAVDKVIAMDGNSVNILKAEDFVFRDHQELEKQKADIKLRQQKSNQLQQVQDFIEDEPLTIDLKISGINKIFSLPIERVGVHSYVSEGTCNHGQQSPQGLIVNVKTQGRKRLISFESQMLIANNNKYPISLVFKIRSINKNSQEIIDKREKGLNLDDSELVLDQSGIAQQLLDGMMIGEQEPLLSGDEEDHQGQQP